MRTIFRQEILSIMFIDAMTMVIRHECSMWSDSLQDFFIILMRRTTGDEIRCTYQRHPGEIVFLILLDFYRVASLLNQNCLHGGLRIVLLNCLMHHTRRHVLESLEILGPRHLLLLVTERRHSDKHSAPRGQSLVPSEPSRKDIESQVAGCVRSDSVEHIMPLIKCRPCSPFLCLCSGMDILHIYWANTIDYLLWLIVTLFDRWTLLLRALAIFIYEIEREHWAVATNEERPNLAGISWT